MNGSIKKMIKSKIIRNKIKELAFTSKNRAYVNDLKDLERLILFMKSGRNLNMGGGMRFFALKKLKEFTDIYNELDPKGYRDLLEMQKKEEKEMKKFMEECKTEEKKKFESERKEWESIKKGRR